MPIQATKREVKTLTGDYAVEDSLLEADLIPSILRSGQAPNQLLLTITPPTTSRPAGQACHAEAVERGETSSSFRGRTRWVNVRNRGETVLLVDGLPYARR